ncbi:predicted protein [Uncinocarpus reesii 1704]|uniref:Myb-like domain-containing protein n=1 Tax=Uncinocarpus reesii (strain UAMH 1704) TaxID=336963 RepID=C4JE19_UNCRE|nr:uncharacterized protein UREG_00443 [Uncinocarpus reesii 1704]EEP75597.1 predicted protein [Uncinocarpus reesii 1704]
MPWNELFETFPGSYSTSSALDDHFFQSKDIPRPHLRIAPLRNPIPPGSRKVPSPLEPSTTGIREPTSSKPLKFPAGNPPTELPTLEGFLKAAPRENELPHILGVVPSSEQPPKNILPAFISLRAVENLPYPTFSDETPRKRRRLDPVGDGFGDLQLPIPKVQKETPKPRPFGPLPVLNELKEPPPNAALFPPIEADRRPVILNPQEREPVLSTEQSFSGQPTERRPRRIEDLIESNDEGEGTNLENQENNRQSSSTQETRQRDTTSQVEQATEGNEKLSNPQKATKPRKKLRRWTEQETHDLLRGVVRCGVGNWTTILTQPDLKFNERTAGNLKDRFRVCCPWAYDSGQAPNSEDIQARLADNISNAQSGLVAKILLPDPRSKTSLDLNKGSMKSNHLSESLAPHGSKPKRSSGLNGSQRLSNLAKSTLMSLGLSDPDTTVKSSRRHRRAFTPAEDEALLKGYAVHGFQWTLIREDKHLNLMHRKATDLRDRFRTKFPHVYREGGFATANKVENNLKSGDSAGPSNFVKPGLPSANSANFSIKDAQVTAAATAVPIDPAVSPPAPPSSLPEPANVPVTPVFPFTTDDGGTVEDNGYGFRWVENTLPPLMWDELA